MNNKKLALLIGLFFIFNSANAIEIYNRTAKGGGPNGYYSTSKVSTTVYLPIPQTSPLFWPKISYTTINCENPGNDACPTQIATSGTSYDDVDVNNVNALVAIADADIANGISSGSEHVQVQVSGEDYLRIYTVTWSTDAAGEVLVSVDRTNV